MDKIEKIDSKPWEYTLFLIDEKEWVLSVPYPVNTMVDSRVNVLLSEQQLLQMKNDRAWLANFAESVRCNVSGYKANDYGVDVSKAYHKMQHG